MERIPLKALKTIYIQLEINLKFKNYFCFLSKAKEFNRFTFFYKTFIVFIFSTLS